MSSKVFQHSYKSTFRDKVHYMAVGAFYISFFSLLAFFFIPLSLAITPVFQDFAKWYVRMGIAVGEMVMGLHAELKDAYKLNSAPKGVIVMNHQSMWDFFMVCSILPQLGDIIHTVLKKEVYYVWPLGYALWQYGSLFIDRSSPAAAMNTLITESRKIFSPSNTKKSKLLIFPEGTRNEKLDGFQKFKRGAFQVAVTLNVPVIPIVCPPQTFKKHMHFFRSANVVLKCLDPVLLDPTTDLDPQIELIKSKMLMEYHKMMDDAGIKKEDE